ncbi:MAG TPA: hypothetical protein ENN80_00770, partial [Candidatus Hydrogenedentes bacterium]|nr:hypothetical protein [Candidatus Hydrogenedentota bacterium]
SYFRWRACLTGAEQYWHGILDHDGVPRRRYDEVARVGKEFAKVAPELKGTGVSTPVALIRSFEDLWSVQRQPAAPDFSYDAHCFACYTAVKRNGHGCRIVSPGADLARYKVVIAPCLRLVNEAIAERLRAFVEAGGVLVLTPQSGTRTPSNAMTDKPRPGLLAELAGLTVEEVRPYHHGQTDAIRFIHGPLANEVCTVGTYVEHIECSKAEALAEYVTEGESPGAAIGRRRYGEGCIYYLGVLLPQDVLERFFGTILPDFAIKGIPQGVEVTRRNRKGLRLIFLINHTREQRTVVLPKAFPELLTGEDVGPKVTIGPNGVLILKAEAA